MHLWRVHHVSLNATGPFQVLFEVRKGSGSSWGGFSVDDINLSETRCPDFTMQFDHFESLLEKSDLGTNIYGPQLYSTGGYSYSVGITLMNDHFGLFVQLLSGENDEHLEWPCPQRQVTFTMVDQSANIQQHMSKQRSITSDRSVSPADGKPLSPLLSIKLRPHVHLFFLFVGSFNWDNPRKVGIPYTDENNVTIYAGPLLGFEYFSSKTEIKRREFVKGGSAVFTFMFDGRLMKNSLAWNMVALLETVIFHHLFPDLTPLVNGSELPCPRRPSPRVPPHPPPDRTSPCLR